MVSVKTGIIGLALAIGGTIFVRLVSAGPPITPPESPTALIPPWFAFNIGTKLHSIFSYLAFVTKPPDVAVIDLATAYWDSEVAYALTRNKILDQVEKETTSGSGTVSCETVAEKLELQSFVVCRFMKSGMYLNLLKQDASTKEYSLTPHGSLLTDTGDLRDFMLVINEELKQGWRAVTTDLMKDGPKPNKNSGFEIAFGKDFWTWASKNPEKGAQFDGAMKSLNPTPTGALIMDWAPPSEDVKLCDIGGGIGSLLGEVLNHYPKMTGIVFDRPKVVDRARAHLESMGLVDRAEVVAGNFFDNSLPDKLSECDVFILRYIIHDWDDDSNVKILKNIRNIAMKSTHSNNKRVVIMDQILDTGALSFFEKSKSLMAINMIANNVYGARERNIQEHVDLFEAAGYDNVALGNKMKFVPLRTIHSVLEVQI